MLFIGLGVGNINSVILSEAILQPTSTLPVDLPAQEGAVALKNEAANHWKMQNLLVRGSAPCGYHTPWFISETSAEYIFVQGFDYLAGGLCDNAVAAGNKVLEINQGNGET